MEKKRKADDTGTGTILSFFKRKATGSASESVKAVENDQSSTKDKQSGAEFSSSEASASSVHSQPTHTSHFISPNDIGLYIDRQVRVRNSTSLVTIKICMATLYF